jgi:hypothetical protein
MQPSESSLAAEIRHDGGKKGINLLRKLWNEQTLLGIMAFACPQHCKTGPASTLIYLERVESSSAESLFHCFF